MKRLLLVLVLLLGAVVGPAANAASTETVVNSDASGGQVSRFDVDGNALDAHDGSLLQVGDLFYLYGTSYACGYCFRPHVVHNAATGQYVMWADAGGRYLVATSPTPTGIFTTRPDPVLAVGGAVDESLYVDADGTGYVIHNTTQVAAGLTADMVVERLTPDYSAPPGSSSGWGSETWRRSPSSSATGSTTR